MNAASSPEDRQIELLATFDEALSSGSTVARDWSSELNETDRRRFEDNQKCLQLLEQLFPRGQAREEEPGATLAGQPLGRFSIVRELGRGGFGIVYLADDPALCRQVALKVPRANVLLTPELRQRFLREARAAGRLNHPNLIRVLDAGQAGPLCYIVSDYCAGPTLAEWIKTNAPCPPVMAARIALSIVRAMAYIHSQGILHRDIKPGNILLEPSPDAAAMPALPFTPRLTDFGLARLVDSTTETVSGAILGTPAYMAPEQAMGRGKELAPAADIYSVGAILYELCTGRPPFAGDEPLEMLTRIVADEIVPLRALRREVPRDLEAICAKCLVRTADQRYESAQALLVDLERFLEGRPTIVRPIPFWKRGLRQARRHPTLTTSIVLAGLMLLGVVLGADRFRQVYDSQEQERAAFAQREVERDAEIERRGQQQESLELQQYVDRVQLAASHWRGQRPDDLADTLCAMRPAGDQEDLRDFSWHYLWRQRPRCMVLRGHRATVDAVAFCQDRLISAANDGQILHWDLNTRRLQIRAQCQVTLNGCWRFFADKSQVAARSHLGELGTTLYDLGTADAHPLAEWTTKLNVSDLAVSPDGRRVALAGGSHRERRGALLLWEPATGKVEQVWEHLGRPSEDTPDVAQGMATAIEFSPDGNRLAIAFNDVGPDQPIDRWTIQLLDLRTRSGPLLREHATHILRVQFSHDGALLASGAFGGGIIVWNVATGQIAHDLHDRNYAAWSLAFSPDNKSLATGYFWPPNRDEAGAHYGVIWDLATEEIQASPVYDTQVASLAFSPDGKELAAGCNDDTIKLVELEPATASDATFAGHAPSEAWGIAFAPDKPVIATSGDDHLCKLWDLNTRQEIARCSGAPNLLLSVAFAPDRPLLATAGYDGAVRLWNSETGQQQRVLKGHVKPVRGLAFSPDGKQLASAGDQTIKLWDAITGEAIATLKDHTARVGSVMFNSDATLISGSDEQLKVWELSTGECLRTLTGVASVWALAHSPQQPLMVVGRKDGSIELRDSTSFEVERLLQGHTDGVRCVAFSPDGRTLVSGGLDRSVRLWHVATGRELLTFDDLPAQVNGVAFSADGRTLGATCHDGSVRLWDAAR